MARAIRLIHMSDGTVITQVYDTEDQPPSDLEVQARVMYQLRVRARVPLRVAAAYLNVQPSNLSAMEHGRVPFPDGAISKLRGLYAGAA